MNKNLISVPWHKMEKSKDRKNEECLLTYRGPLDYILNVLKFKFVIS